MQSFLSFGIDAQPFINSASQALPSIAIMSAWQGMGINPALYEAAEMDHATPWQKFKDITLPELETIVCVRLITITIGAFRMPGTANGYDRRRTIEFNVYGCV